LNIPSTDTPPFVARVVAVCVSAGGIPKRPVRQSRASARGLEGDFHAHEKHNRPDRAISILDWEILQDLVAEGFSLHPGTAGENLTVRGLNVQRLAPGELLEIGRVLLRLEQPRKPCYVLDDIDPRLKDAVVGRCGYMASVLRPGTIRPGMTIARMTCRSTDWCPSTLLSPT
jgi:MOSC domain-containing protein YiiM